MSLPPVDEALRDRFLRALLEAASSLQAPGLDREVTLPALIAAAELLRGRFEHELAELRQEAAD